VAKKIEQRGAALDLSELVPPPSIPTQVTTAGAEPIEQSVEFTTQVDLTHGRLEARRGLDGFWEAQLTLKNVIDGDTEATARALADEINLRFRRLTNWPSCYRLTLSSNGDLPVGSGDVVIRGLPFVIGSTNRARSEEVSHNFIGPQESQNCYLNDQRLEEMPNDAVRLMVGMIRLAEGFPSKAYMICRHGDRGDALAGNVVRTKIGPHSDAVLHTVRGIGGADVDDMKADRNVGAAGRVLGPAEGEST
jgi:hypothetical protein